MAVMTSGEGACPVDSNKASEVIMGNEMYDGSQGVEPGKR